ncbi:hypothetical protein ASD8599_02968 [Ascidiaceihabitans donghaensis]|uniref:Uncharacterized protein n=1 Tax=Ascidiaceihabitans donghaensis TaxID=1510460 RepID=A0A2R8BGK9_9RHOB|nr:hypothetical protein ASD8599_02968 [Ascidiaceihabitans donghaensis]
MDWPDKQYDTNALMAPMVQSLHQWGDKNLLIGGIRTLKTGRIRCTDFVPPTLGCVINKKGSMPEHRPFPSPSGDVVIS